MRNLPVQPDSKGVPSITYRNSALEGFVRNDRKWSICFNGPSPVDESYTGENLVRFRRYCENNIESIAEGCNVYGLENVLVAAYVSGVSDGSSSSVNLIKKSYPNVVFREVIQDRILDDYIDAAYASSTPVQIVSNNMQDPRISSDEAYKRFRLGIR